MKTSDNGGAGLTVTVCVSPLRRLGRKNVGRELNQVRCALLYADRVHLVSTTVAMLETFRPLLPLVDLTGSSLWDEVRRLPDHTLQRMYGTDKVRPIRKDLARLTQLRQDDYRRTQLEAHFLPEILRSLREAADLYEHMRTPDLDLARERGALTVELERFELDDAETVHKEWFRDQVLTAWRNPVGTVLLDERAQRALRAGVPPDDHPAAALGRAKRAATGSGLVAQLPTFPGASMEDVLEVRDELADDRRQYRNAVRDLAETLASSALDETLASEVEEIWHDMVGPALKRMGETVSLSRLARNTGRRLFGDVPGLVKSGSVLTVSVAALHGTPDSPLSLAGGLGLGGYVLGTALQEAVDERRKNQSHEFVYLADTDKMLKSLRSRSHR